MFKKGQKVWDVIYGAGVVKRIRQESGEKYPVLVRLNDDLHISYTMEGKVHSQGNISLFPYPVEVVKACY